MHNVCRALGGDRKVTAGHRTRNKATAAGQGLVTEAAEQPGRPESSWPAASPRGSPAAQPGRWAVIPDMLLPQDFKPPQQPPRTRSGQPQQQAVAGVSLAVTQLPRPHWLRGRRPSSALAGASILSVKQEAGRGRTVLCESLVGSV